VPASAVLALALLPFLGSVVFLAHGAARRRRWRVRPHWRTTEARVLGPVTIPASSPVGSGARAGPSSVTRFAYEYRVGVRLYTAYLEQVPLRMRRGRGPRRGPVRAGSRLSVRYDPATPEHVVPEGHVEWAAPLSLAVGVVCLLVAGLLAASAAWTSGAR
jgi:hypothetical protein